MQAEHIQIGIAVLIGAALIVTAFWSKLKPVKKGKPNNPKGNVPHDKACRARIEYEFNCRMKYDRPYRISKPIPKGERMEDYAVKFGVAVEEMGSHEDCIDKMILENGK